MPYISIVMLGMAVSFDGFGAGFAYGLRRLHIPPVSLFIICFSSAISVFVSMKAGSFASNFFSPQVASVIGGVMLMGVGFLIIRQSLQAGIVPQPGGDSKKRKEKGLSLLSGMLREPALADFDCSGVITAREAAVLGMALAMDAFGAGFGAAMMGFAPGTTSLAVGITKFILLTGGLMLGKRYSQRVSGERAAVFAGLVLMILGVAHLLS